MQDIQYPVNELFETIQGEGFFTGTPAIFLRLQGCDVGCSWCDTKQTWEVDTDLRIAVTDLSDKSGESPSWASCSVADVISLLKQGNFSATHIVITGGEPCIYDLLPLTEALVELGFSVQIETSGTYAVSVDEQCWVTVSPKLGMRGGREVLQSALVRANEIKHPIAMQKHIDELDTLLAGVVQLDEKVICLQPISQKPGATKLAIETCIARNWQLSVQLHKYLGIE